MNSDFDEAVATAALNRNFGSRPRTAIALMENFGSAKAVYSLSRKELEALPFNVRSLIRTEDLAAEHKELEALGKSGISFIGYTHDAYPQLLKECNDPPTGLYVRSSTKPMDLFAARKRIAIVGTRNASDYGMEWCGKLVAALSRTIQRPCIVSGLAYGIDICAHRHAVEHNLPTIAVLPTGADTVYPAHHSEFARRMCNTENCGIITDYPPRTSSYKVNFVRRNRIIAGLCDATILIESRRKGGGMITANFAFNYNREVYALPGRIDDSCSQGCNALIKAKIAEAITDIDGLIDSLALNCDSGTSATPTPEETAARYRLYLPPEKAEITTEVLRIICLKKGISIEEIAVELELKYSVAAETVSILENDGIIRTDLLQRCFYNTKNA